VEQLKVKSKQLDQLRDKLVQKKQHQILSKYQDQFKDNSKMRSLKKVGIMGKNIENNSKA
jgi:hypothetical protein